MIRRFIGVATLVFLAFIQPAFAQNQELPIWPGQPPGTENWTQKERVIKNTPIGTVILNVVRPTLTVYLPDRNKATGTGIMVAPGGACAALAMDVEGTAVVRSLQKHGIAAFVLKYRIPEKKQEGIPNVDPDIACKYGIADAIQAVKVVRQHAAQWGVDPHRIGVMGFSAGGMVVSGALLQPEVAARPDFAAFVYGAPFGVMPVIPPKLPPVFMAWAQDYTVAQEAFPKFYDALRSAGNKPEAHIFSSGGHGFGMKKQGTTSDYWSDEFYHWLTSQHLLKSH